MTRDRVDVAIVGAGPAGATLAARLARTGVEVELLERAPVWRWRAGGVFASPAAVGALADAGLDGALLATVARPIPAMRLETPGGAVARLTYGSDAGGAPAVGFDRAALDPALVALARDAGARVRVDTTVTRIVLGPRERVLDLRTPDGDVRLLANVVVGADGARSIVGRAAGVDRPVRLGRRVGLTYHLPDPRPDDPVDARMRLFDDGYVGIAPVPGQRVNVGIVLGPSWRARLATEGAAHVAGSIVAAIPPADDDQAAWRSGRPCDAIAGAAPLGVRVTRRSGHGWLLVGDAAGFLDPFTGEGLHRAVVSSDLAARAVRAALDDRGASDRAFDAYDRAMRRRFASKDAVSWLVQAFLARPPLFEYAARRLATRPDVRATMGLVMGDLVPASRGLDPRFLAALLAP